MPRNSPRSFSSPASRIQGSPRAGPSARISNGVQRDSPERRQPTAPSATPPGLKRRKAVTSSRQHLRGVLPGAVVAGRHVALEDAGHPVRVERGVQPGGPDEREAVTEIHAIGVHVEAVQGDGHAGGHGVAVKGLLDLGVDALEALLGEAEAGGVLVQAAGMAWSAGSARSPRRPLTRSQAEAPAPRASAAGAQVGSSRSAGQRSAMNRSVSGR